MPDMPSKCQESLPNSRIETIADRLPVHTVYGGADRFRADTATRFGQIAKETLTTYAPNPDEFRKIFAIDSEAAAIVFRKTIEKLSLEPVEDFRIDFEDGFGFRPDREEDETAIVAAHELADAIIRNQAPPFFGIRVRPFAPETGFRARRTIELFTKSLAAGTGRFPSGFVVTIPKVRSAKEVELLTSYLDRIEKRLRIRPGTIGIELMIETPEAIFGQSGRLVTRELVTASGGRCRSVHFGAYDYTALLGIGAADQDIRHSACIFARSAIQAALAGSGVRIVDSVTLQMPIAPNKKDRLTKAERGQNFEVVRSALRRHFDNITLSLRDGFFQSWDLHPNQLIARYAAIYSYFIQNAPQQAARLGNFLAAATKASLTGNIFDDAASAEGAVNFFQTGIGCGAFSDDDVHRMLGIGKKDLYKGFPEMVSTVKPRSIERFD